MTESEVYISALNSNIFFKEFSFCKNKFKVDLKGEELELADNVIWLNDILIITQIEECDKTIDLDTDEWFKNKVQGKAVEQIKDTIRYFDIYSDSLIENEKGHVLNTCDAKKIEPFKLIIYAPHGNLSWSNNSQKFYNSKEVGLIHLFEIKDYLWVCKYLITPFEIAEYLKFRESIFRFQGQNLENLPEQYILGHYLKETDDLNINMDYINYVIPLVNNFEKFDISPKIEYFQRIALECPDAKQYYCIIKELAKLDKLDTLDFILRFEMTLMKAVAQEFEIPFRMTSVHSNCGFVFIPLDFNKKSIWENAIQNFTIIYKYEQKLDKVVTMLSFFDPQKGFHQINWAHCDWEWEYKEELEKIITEDFPWRSENIEKTFNYDI